MDVYVADSNLQTVALVDYAKSVIWHTEYCGAGNFELYVPANETALSVLREGHFLYRKDNETTMIIEKIDIQTSFENGNYIIVSGRSAESVIGRRIVWSQTNLSGRVCECVKSLLNTNLISAEGSRRISIVKMGECITAEERMTKQITGDNLLEAIIEILSTYGLGFKLSRVIERVGGVLNFQITRGVDRSVGNSEGNPQVKFSPGFDNLLVSTFSSDSTNLRNVVLVAGEGEGTARKTASVGEASGLDRREAYLDNNGISSNDGEISNAEYNNLLIEAGKESLAQTQVVQVFDGEIEPNANYVFGKDYSLGDIVTLENEYHISSNVRIIGVTENMDENGNNLVLSYANV